jgi:hypothetical protein
MTTASNTTSIKNQHGDLANVTIKLATVINKHLAEENPSCRERGHDIHDIVREVFLGE